MKYDIESINKRNDRIAKIKLITQKLAFALLIILIYNILLVTIANANKTDINLFGYKAYIITTDSMAPNIRRGDITIVKKSKEEELKIGSIITFSQNDEIITHRIIEIISDEIETSYVTKGDNNNIPDSEQVLYEQLEGTVIYSIPYLGNVITVMRDKFFIVYVILICCIIYASAQKIQSKKEIRREKKKIEDQKFKEKNK